MNSEYTTIRIYRADRKQLKKDAVDTNKGTADIIHEALDLWRRLNFTVQKTADKEQA